VAIYFHRVNRNLADADNNLRRANETLTSSLEEIRELHLRLKEQAIRDPLTGLYNRRYLDDTLERELSRAKREGYPLRGCEFLNFCARCDASGRITLPRDALCKTHHYFRYYPYIG
jgi:hypothetical protein